VIGKILSVVVGCLLYFLDGTIDIGDRVALVPLGLGVASRSLQVRARKPKVGQRVKKCGVLPLSALLVFLRLVCRRLPSREGC
jgi:hypothetical protein